MAELATCTACGSTDLGWQTETGSASETPSADDWTEESGLGVTETCRSFRVCHDCGHRWEATETHWAS
jgi:hypothetical protein